MGILNLFNKRLNVYGAFLIKGRDVKISEFKDGQADEKALKKAAALMDGMLEETGRDNLVSIFVASSKNNIFLLIEGNTTIGVLVDKKEIPGKVEFEVMEMKEKIEKAAEELANSIKKEKKDKEDKEKIEKEKEIKKEPKEEKQVKPKVKKKEEKPKEEKKKKPQKETDYTVNVEIMDKLYDIGEEYLMDFVDEVFENQVEDAGLNPKEPTYKKLSLFISGMEESASMMLGPSVAEEMSEKMRGILNKYKK